MLNFIKKILDWFSNKCECGGTFIAWDDKHYYCNKCDKEL